MRHFAVIALCLLVAPVLAAPPIIPSPPQLSATGYLLIDATTGVAIVEQNSDEQLPPASLTKIMTSYVTATEIDQGRISMDDMVDVSVKAWRMEGSRMFIQEGTRVRLEDLLRGVIIQSGNDASVAVAEYVAGSEDAFADIMNQHAQRLGMTSTHFMNATGLPSADHHTTARDLATLTVALINQYPEHYKMYSEKYFTFNNIRQANRNALLWRDDSVDGVKTGHTDAAGYCLVASASRDNMRLISVVMGTNSEEARATESQKLLSYGFRYFETVSLYRGSESLQKARVWGGAHGAINLGILEDIVLTIPRGSRDELTAAVDIGSEIHAPLAQDEAVGTLTVSLGDEVLVTRDLVALNPVAEAGFVSRLWDSVALFFLKLFDGDPLALP